MNQVPRSLKRRLLSSGFWALAGRLASMGSLLWNYRLVCERLSPAEVSLYVVSLGIAGLGSLICGSGLGSVLLRHLSQKDASGVALDQKRFIGRVFGYSFASWILFAIAFYCLLEWHPAFFRQPIRPLFGLLLFWIGARCFLSLVTETLRAMQVFWLAALSGGQQEGPLVNLFMTLLLLGLGSKVNSIEDVLLMHVVVTWIVATAVGFPIYRLLKIPTAATGEVPDGGQILSESFKVFAAQMSIFGIVELETIYIGRYCTDAEIGAWGAIRRLISFVSAPLLLINAAIPSFIAELYSRNDLRRMEKLLRGAATASAPPSILAFLLLFFLGGPILQLFDPKFLIGWDCLALLAASNIIFVVSGSAGLTLRMTNHQGWATASTMSLAVLYVITAPWVVQQYGIWGAAVLASINIICRNLIATLLVRGALGIWCVPSYRIDDIRQLFQSLKRRNAKKIESV